MVRGLRALVWVPFGALVVSACSGSVFVATGDNDASLLGQGGAAASSGGTGGASASSGGKGGSSKGGAPSGTGGRYGVGGTGTSGGAVGLGTGGARSVDASVADAGPTSCTSSSDCPSPGTVCQAAACLGSQCGFVAAPLATPPGNAAGDCRKIVCSPNGSETILVDPNDADDGNECTVDSCQGAVASHTPSVGSHCQGGTKYCDAAGKCVECLTAAQCQGGSTECSKASCVQGTCSHPAAGALCNGGVDQCDGQGNCIDCWDNGGCDECCFCLDNICVQG